MSSIKGFKLLAIMLVSAMLVAMAIPAALAEEKTAAGPDLSVIVGSTGSGVGGANVYLDGSLAGKTDSKGNFTLKEAPAAGNHTILVSAKGLNNATVETNFAEKPVVVKMDPTKGYVMTVHVTDKNSKQGIAGVSVTNGKYVMGTTDAMGSLTVNNCPLGLYLIKMDKAGYKSSTSVLIVYTNKTQSYALTPSV